MQDAANMSLLSSPLLSSLDGSVVIVNDTRWRLYVVGMFRDDDMNLLQLQLQNGPIKVDITIETNEMTAPEVRDAVALTIRRMQSAYAQADSTSTSS